jgi:MoaA/NifB/PqqE/SkfB family radical SAM enzyme
MGKNILSETSTLSFQELLKSSKIERIGIEFTDDCNLRCVYCSVSQPDYKGAYMNNLAIKKINRFITENRVGNIMLNGHGETTMISNWTNLCNYMMNASPESQFTIISNFAKLMEDEEIETLARFGSITISFDVPDSVTLKKIRRKVALEKIALNVLKIKTFAVMNGLTPILFILGLLSRLRNRCG